MSSDPNITQARTATRPTRRAYSRRWTAVGVGLVLATWGGWSALEHAGVLGSSLGAIPIPKSSKHEDADAHSETAGFRGRDALEPVARGNGEHAASPTDASVENGGESRPSVTRSQALALARKSCRLADLDAFIAQQRQRAAQAEAQAAEHRVLAEALYERVLARDLKRGFAIGKFVGGGESADANLRDLNDADQALEAARAAGDQSGDIERLAAGIMTCRLNGIGAALRLQGKISASLEKALEREPTNGHAHVAVGCRLLFVPRWLGQDLDKAIEHFEFADRVLPHNERPSVFAAFAESLRGRKEAAVAWLEKASQRNPRNPFVEVVLRRLRAGEEKPFERDIE